MSREEPWLFRRVVSWLGWAVASLCGDDDGHGRRRLRGVMFLLLYCTRYAAVCDTRHGPICSLCQLAISSSLALLAGLL